MAVAAEVGDRLGQSIAPCDEFVEDAEIMDESVFGDQFFESEVALLAKVDDFCTGQHNGSIPCG